MANYLFNVKNVFKKKEKKGKKKKSLAIELIKEGKYQNNPYGHD